MPGSTNRTRVCSACTSSAHSRSHAQWAHGTWDNASPANPQYC